MREGEARQAAEILLRHWQFGTRLAALPDELRPATRRDGYAIQAHLGDDAKLYGWKIAATSLAGQQHIAVSSPIAGRMFADTVISDVGTCSLAGNAFRLAEPEFAFRMAHDVSPRAQKWSPQDALDAVSTLHSAIELPDSRFTDVTQAGEAQIIADNACAHRFVLGPAAPDGWRDLDLATLQPVAHVGTRYSRDGLGANVLGGPRIALAWLMNELSSLGITLRTGAIVTTGTCMVPLDVQPGETVTIDFGALGAVSVHFAT